MSVPRPAVLSVLSVFRVRRRSRSLPVAAVLTVLAVMAVSPLVVVPPAAGVRSCPAFLAVAAPYATVDGHARAGSVTLFQERSGRMAPVQVLRQGAYGLGDAPEHGDAFGSALARGDFDGDGCDDLAIGASEEVHGPPGPVPGADGAGVVHLLYGTPRGLRAAGTVDVTRLGRSYGTDRLGAALAAGDLDGDGDDELVAGAPGLGGGGGAGVFGMDGRRPDGEGVLITQLTRWVGQDSGETDQFGAALATGDFDGDGRAEIAVGAPGDGGPRPGSGVVTVLDPRRRHAGVFTQESPGVQGGVEEWDAFGAALASGDFDADGRDDLAIGVPGEDLTPFVRGMDYGDGAVNVLYGSGRGLTGLRGEPWSRRVLAGRPRYSDRFGAALAAGDLNGDGDDELVVGVPGAGAVQVIAGTRSGGLTRRHSLLVHAGKAAGGHGGDFGMAVLVRRGRLFVSAPAAGTVTRVGTEARKGPYTGVRPHVRDTLHDAARGDSQGDALFGYALG
ncbi:FG-GAP repeat protein [Sphaerimonospora sp. CA-214678]|uniref:FG-GAP repeat protein n=1 Tax=Sphaerimonospora sp. CA-214678 TaxID=3240029 RepID=UPI003D8CDF38